MLETTVFEGKKYLQGQIYDLPQETYNAIYPSAKHMGFDLDVLDSKLHVNSDYFDFFSYPLDGYGRLNRFLKDNLLFLKGNKKLLYCGTPTILGIEKNKSHNKNKIIITMFESDRLPVDWVNVINRFAHAVFVPSSFCLEVFEKSGVTVPTYKLPLFYIHKDYTLQEHEKFTFGHQNSLIMGHQKGDDVLLDAYLDKFRDNPDTLLILKGRKHHYQALDHKFIKRAQRYSNVKVIIEDYTDDEVYSKFYSQLDCFVFPSRGEGFGIPPLEAMGLGIPTITTDGHSIKDYVEYAIPVKTKGYCKSYYVGRTADSKNNRWQQIDRKDLGDKMLNVYNDYKHYKQQAEKNVSKLRELYSPKVFVNNLNSLLQNL